MKEINWTQIGKRYIADLENGSVVISPSVPPNPHRPYAVYLQTTSGEIVAAESFDLETCKIWAQVMLPLVDQQSGKLYECGNVIETLEKCQGLLSHETDAGHWLRIEYLKKSIGEYTEQPYEVVALSLPQNTPDVFNWVEEGTKFYVDTADGRLIIEETRDKNIIGAGVRHNAQIVHRSGAVLDCGSFVDFLEAEAELKRRVGELGSPYIYEALLDYIHFTLEVCARLLSEDTDPIHCARLGNLGTAVHLALD